MCKTVKSPSLETGDQQTTEKLKHKELCCMFPSSKEGTMPVGQWNESPVAVLEPYVSSHIYEFPSSLRPYAVLAGKNSTTVITHYRQLHFIQMFFRTSYHLLLWVRLPPSQWTPLSKIWPRGRRTLILEELSMTFIHSLWDVACSPPVFISCLLTSFELTTKVISNV